MMEAAGTSVVPGRGTAFTVGARGSEPGLRSRAGVRRGAMPCPPGHGGNAGPMEVVEWLAAPAPGRLTPPPTTHFSAKVTTGMVPGRKAPAEAELDQLERTLR